MKLNKIVDDIAKDPKKGLIWAVLILIIMIALYYAWKKLAAIWADVKTSIDNTLDNPVESGNLSHEAVWYKNAAESMFTAMDGLGTDWGTIERIIIAIQNQDDWNKLVREYGTRTLSRFLQSNLTGTLQVHLKDDCSQSEISWISNYLRLVKQTNAGL